jgi:hypothetical protein
MNSLAYIAIIALIIVVLYTCKEHLISGGKPEFVFYYNPNCRFCQPVYPEWEQLRAMDIRCVNLISVDLTSSSGGQFASDRGDIITHTPTIVFYPFGKYMVHERYQGPRFSQDMFVWLSNRIKTMNLC